MSGYSGDLKIEPFRAYCAKCGSSQRAKVTFMQGPHPRTPLDYLRWNCVECGVTWATNTADYKVVK